MKVTVLTGSMKPVILPGASVDVRSDLRVRPGDVAAIESDGRLIIHRIRARIDVGRRTWFVHQGDASDRAGLADAREIVGVVPGMWRRPEPPANLLLLRLGALFRHIGVPKSIARAIRRQ